MPMSVNERIERALKHGKRILDIAEEIIASGVSEKDMISILLSIAASIARSTTKGVRDCVGGVNMCAACFHDECEDVYHHVETVLRLKTQIAAAQTKAPTDGN